MDIDKYLETIELIDCSGQVTHKLTLQIDGRVKVTAGAVSATVDPTARLAEPPSVKLGRGEYGHDQVIDIACNMALGK